MFSLRYKIMIFSLLMTIVPILVVGSFSYIISTQIVRKQASELNLDTIKQIAYNIEFVINDVQDISLSLINNEKLNQYLKSSVNRSIVQYNPDIQSLIEDYILTKKYVYSIFIQDINGNGIDTQGAHNPMSDSDLSELKRLNGKKNWSLTSVNVTHTELKVISLSREIKDVNNINRDFGILKINISQAQIQSIYNQKIINEQGLFFMIDQQHTVLSSQSNQMIGHPLNERFIQPELFENSEGYYNATIDRQKYLVEFYTIKETGWKVINYVPFSSITKPGKAIKQVAVISTCLSLLICLLFLLYFMVKVLEPLKQIRRLMGNLINGNFNVNMNVQGNDEIALLCWSFNKMSRKLDELINEVQVHKIKQKEAEIKALQEQINPHFLYNTLDLIYWMGRMEKAFETSSMIQALSKLFRLGLNGGSGFTTVRKEVEHIENYILIQQKRYEQNITFDVKVDPEILDYKVNKLVLQPLVENAITHGIEQKGGVGRIEVRIYKDEDKVIYEITDNGVGMDPAVIEDLMNPTEGHNRGVGLKNIQDRIKLSFGQTYGLQVESIVGLGTKMIVTQAIRKGIDENV